MDDTPTRDIAPAGWLEALAESDADLAAGRIISGDVVMRDLKDSLARLEAKAAAKKLARKDSRRRWSASPRWLSVSFGNSASITRTLGAQVLYVH
jgi:hypothetical protein